MALVGSDLGTDIKNAVVTEFAIDPSNQGDLERWAQAVGNAIIDYIKANAELDTASLDGSGVTGDIVVGSFVNGQVTTTTVSGGVK